MRLHILLYIVVGKCVQLRNYLATVDRRRLRVRRFIPPLLEERRLRVRRLLELRRLRLTPPTLLERLRVTRLLIELRFIELERLLVIFCLYY